MPMRLPSEVKGNICRTRYVRIWPPGVLSCMDVRSLLTSVRPTLSVHCTRATWRRPPSNEATVFPGRRATGWCPKSLLRGSRFIQPTVPRTWCFCGHVKYSLLMPPLQDHHQQGTRAPSLASQDKREAGWLCWLQGARVWWLCSCASRLSAGQAFQGPF